MVHFVFAFYFLVPPCDSAFLSSITATHRNHPFRSPPSADLSDTALETSPNRNDDKSVFYFEREEVTDMTTSVWAGAGSPRPGLAPEEIPGLLMDALRMNDLPTKDAGLRSVWEFAGDTTRHIFQHNLTDFIESAHQTADTMATSFYGVAMKGKEWSMETSINRVGGADGWIATQVMKTISWDGRVRRWQWELRKHRRPPNLGAWYVESIGSSDRKGNFEADD